MAIQKTDSELTIKLTQGLSMLPLIAPGSTIYYKKTTFSRLKIDDLVLYRQGSEFVCHRVVYKTARYLIAKGDNNLDSDGRIYPSQVVGKLTKVKCGRGIITPESVYLMQSSHYFKEINQINQVFSQAQLDYLFLKGLPLHLYFERSHPRRFYADCDVLIDGADLPKAVKILKKQGYVLAAKKLSPWRISPKRYEPELVFHKSINGFVVTFDLHQELVFMMTELGKLNWLYPRRLLDKLTALALATKRTISLRQQHYPILKANLLVLYLALHLFHHNFVGAARYQFLEKVISVERRSSRLKWPEFNQLIKQYSLQNYLNPVFTLLKKYYRVSIPINLAVTKLTKTNRLDIFSEKRRLSAGLTRFGNLFWLSSRPFSLRVLTFVDPTVIFTILWVTKQYLFGFKLFQKKP
ncbi:hypothetical protein A2313_00880 [Candidatus Roizmanbacteria bacterium RIFOXYB2_FULL_41_10]|uniref:Peptidase S24/S26A/S26B/S26C domain-containing protein n=1 Tax=Candidatus Roizmanbacteria bacterium RIFOXYA1_FULL_41_12 TaxID=1802082 RepID=A0A1F7KFB9_9BACT|nr:MAG: hypothetical protein A2262_03695 [Candidatus Roizmanbacteria bacterium RIFOXYA2_FULL_41_8]OGK66549.1 MAG: hypothetical protein A2209_00935 [Candidatus Roizmanbacteria bacterium RIFOXYA1_FULL_41_12]OGK67248.1 MAG: hypothetical protein A2377_01375 [Candidatus Roizmanbacteria bacterium RIFOXYB1_FULL_41_27]OGK69320.1 MAG: hypothetical protein A2313_00880 [Candidatus Roizmanbacteria bacterium RIFOXYB2_FULL_41_10]OGK71778.1 MAG: hypothetical protein A2403_00245 [Candidatus Roizmanbacteria bac